jgi:uncharacterized protein (DUF983 family)
MLKKGSKLYSILTGSCPRCHQESMYVEKNPFIISKTLTMHDNCSHCNLKYQIEPSFFYGAMYVSYALNVALSILVFLLLYFQFHLGVTPLFFSILFANIIFYPFVLRLARNIYINLFVNFNKEAAKK